MFTTEILYQPAYAMARLTMSRGAEVRAEAGAMVSMSGTVEVDTKAQGGLMKSLGRSVLGGESFFMNTFRATADNAELVVAPTLPGDIEVMPLDGQELVVQSGSYLASDLSITVDTKWGGAKSFFVNDDDAAEFARTAPGFQRVHIVEDSGHSVQSDQPRALVELLRGVLGD